jgi:thiamine-monophosphate kinase
MSRSKQFTSEMELIEWLKKHASSNSRGLLVGIGDDAALLKPHPGHHWAITADLTVEGIHFSQRLHPADAVGHRALARSLSDIAAMGGVPRYAVVSLVLTRQTDRDWIELFHEGMRRLADRFGVSIVGGDTAFGSRDAMADVTVLGEVERGRALLRSGARPGDSIFVAGKLGASALGFHVLQSGGRAVDPEGRRAVESHLYPEPQGALGRYLASRKLASAAIDLSDGLSSDLHRLAKASKVGACVYEESLPIAACGLDASENKTFLRSLALHGGEDYKLLFTVHAARVKLIPPRFRGLNIYKIGEIRDHRTGVKIVRGGKLFSLKPEGYDHLRQR